MLNTTTTVIHPNFKRTRLHRSSRRHFVGRERAAVIRAMTAAKLYLNTTVPTLAAAAIACGSNIPYVRAAVILVESENTTLVNRVAAGHMNLIEAACDIRRVADLVKAYRFAAPADQVAFARTIGPANLFDTVVAPAI